MQNALMPDDWQILVRMFPRNWKELAKSTKAIVRKFRSFDNEESVMKAILLHIAGGYSLRETATRISMSNIASISDVALLKRLKCSEAWLKELCLSLLKEKGMTAIAGNGEVRMRLVDGTNVKEPGKTGSLWRIHYSILLPDLHCDYFKLTPTEGPGTGESFKQFPIQKGDCIIGDRGYSTAQGMAYVKSQGGYSLVRVNTKALELLKRDRSALNLLAEIRQLKREYASKELQVAVGVDGKLIEGRLCIVRKSKASTDIAIKKLKRASIRKQRKLSKSTKEFAKYVILFTTLPEKRYSLESVLNCYRFRWQIELVFKRLKTLVGLGHLPKYDEVSARAWLYGKLFVGLLTEKLIYQSKAISPWGY